MPSHSVKQAKVMSAISHGWRPSGLDIPVKVAKDFHAADAGKKYGAGDKKAKALRIAKKAGGGSVGNFNPERANAFGIAKQGMIKSSVPGRTDKLNLDVPSGSYIIPADIVSARGQGNSAAGASIMDKMFNRGPYGMGVSRSKGPRIGSRQTSLGRMNKRGFADGGNTGVPTPIVAAGGEYVVHPETVANLGNGDINLGHDILDAFVKHTREQHISTLKGLKPPKGSS